MIDKLKRIGEMLKGMESVLVAYSGGVDSTLLLYLAIRHCSKTLAAVATSPTFPRRELEHAKNIAQSLNVNYVIIESNELDIPNFIKNRPDRCYWCKEALFTKLKALAREHNISYVLDGTNIDDLKDIRPGIKALSRLSIRSPLKEVGLTKKDIRMLSKKFCLSTWNKPPFACLASRIPYGEEITKEKLEKIRDAEEFLQDLSFSQVRVRIHNDIARIELERYEMNKALKYKEKIAKRFKELGFLYVTLDLEGYRGGSMNVLPT